ncbi:tRNA uridine 5-carboxymethylaminomethyl modification enzyme MnmG [endosymbiont of Euscepes postfasciatus]|uniref:tRNA uridine-5-carboxymethylaminomethyl(34) synthesis enzyme MnmG n=1 Tax=endosymbiont of Euscepes postfasciatus TaxID=650377 RepID=UPI000DC73237|nr:tRNA uridine-5-carboxymethylaminomethyl(34) synthesis enzyme MnmG [endosymbiont of Euscepes postfasciatus]BBA84644.1 tRNA uridine 5-carboxymethylaminomethyl modification enzyme MnmG [endosymbiont of Euscepes postfasciatus]
MYLKKNINKNFFDVIVIGGGHSGVEASNASSKMGCKTLLITNNIDSIGQMSCNPSIGGIGKSHLVKEIDALGGIMSMAIDRSGIQFRKLNTSKGLAVQSTRAQADRYIYSREVKKILFSNKNLYVFQDKVIKLLINNNKINGISTVLGFNFFSKSVILCLGTFLNGFIYIGTKFKYKGGRSNDISSTYLSNQLKEIFPFSINKLKTGTPPRLDLKTINFNKLNFQKSDYPIPMFSFIKQNNNLKKIYCYITYTNENTHNIIYKNLHYSPMYTNKICSIGPRYCPSIEDKIIKFKDKKSHHIFLEPESLFSNEIYPNGISTSLPINIQFKIIKSIKGLEKCRITRPGYAVEYNFLDPKNLYYTLESKIISGLFISGQLNGTTGYEEAASQGIISGINAALFSKNMESWYPKKEYSYIGLMIKDLCDNGVIEPYRMFTSRSENRFFLREDNADMRLTKYGYNLGLINEFRWKIFVNKKNNILNEKNRLKNLNIDIKKINNKINKKINIEKKEINAFELLKLNEISYKDILNIIDYTYNKNKNYIEEIYKLIEIDIKYEYFILKQKKEVDIKNKFLKMLIPKDINYNNISGLSNESKYLLYKYRPNNIEDILKIPNITSSSIFILIIWIKNNRK